MQGAGGTSGGVGRFFVGLLMMATGGYLLLDAIRVASVFRWNLSLYSWGGVGLTTGSILIVFVFGVGFLFYNFRSLVGWALTAGSLVALIFGILRRLQFHLEPISLFDLLLMLVLLFGGVGFFLSSFREYQLNDRREAL